MTVWFALYPHVGGGRGTYLELGEALRKLGRCHVPTLPGRDQRYGEPFLRSFTALADDLWRQLLAALDDGRSVHGLVLFGFSMGALLATEMALRLERSVGQPRGLVVAGSAPPHLLDRDRSLGLLPDDAFIAALAEQGVMPESVRSEPELVNVLLPIWRADCAAVASHPGQAVALRCPVLAFGGADDPAVPPRHLLAWETVGGVGSAVRVVPGGHAAVLARRDLLLAAFQRLAGTAVGVPVERR